VSRHGQHHKEGSKRAFLFSSRVVLAQENLMSYGVPAIKTVLKAIDNNHRLWVNMITIFEDSGKYPHKTVSLALFS
jgi:hypothetical protein